jgi:hypothetical protein
MIKLKELNPWEAETDEQVMASIKSTVDTYAHPFCHSAHGFCRK